MSAQSPARRRLLRDLRQLQEDPPTGVTGAPLGKNLFLWHAFVFGPEDTPWEGGIFELSLEFGDDYPNRPPRVTFATEIFHPNVYADGKLCLDILSERWSPVLDVSGILLSIRSLLPDPNPDSPANSHAARLYVGARSEYERFVRLCVQKSIQKAAAGGLAEETAA